MPLLLMLFFLQSHAAAQSLSVEGFVINSVDGNGLPLCVVHLFADGRSVAKAVSDYSGWYSMPHVPVGNYDIVVVQFGDTLCHYKGLSLLRNTLIRHYVQPPMGEIPEPTIDYSLGVKLLRPVTLRVPSGNLLAYMGLLITDPNDPRLWDFSGRMDSFEEPDISFWYSNYKLFYKLRKMGYNITSPFELMYPEVHHPASDSNAVNYKIWILGIKIK